MQDNWSRPTQIGSGPGRLAELLQGCRDLDITRPLAVTDPGIAGLSLVTGALAQLRAAGLAVGTFSGLAANPGETHVAAGVAAARMGGHDGIIAIGGGSAMDTVKAAALMAGQSRWLSRVAPAGINRARRRPSLSRTWLFSCRWPRFGICRAIR